MKKLAVILLLISSNVLSSEIVRNYSDEMIFMDENKELVFAVSFIHNARTTLEFCNDKYAKNLVNFDMATNNHKMWVSDIEKKMESGISKVVYSELKSKAISKAELKLKNKMLPLSSCISLTKKVASGKLPPSIQKSISGNL